MANKTKVRTYKQAVVNAVIIALVLFLFLFLAIQLSRNFSTKISTQRTQTVTDSKYAYLNGYIFRDETALISEGDVTYKLFQNGEKVGVGQTYAEVYVSTGLPDSDAEKKQAELDALSLRIRLLENSLGEKGTLGSLSTVNDAVLKSYYAYTDALADFDHSASDTYGNELVSGLIEHSALVSGEAAKNVLDDLKNERAELLSSIGQSKKVLVSDESFNFFDTVDGYESIFNSSKLEDLSPKALETLMDTKADTRKDGVIGKKVLSSKWYIAVPAQEATYLSFSVGKSYFVTFSENGIEADMLLERICVDEEDENCAYMLFSSFDLLPTGTLARQQSIRIHLGDCTGYRIPSEAAHINNGIRGVYVLVGNTVEFRRITVIGEGVGYYIVNTYQTDAKEENVSSIPYLNANDMVITSGNDLYDGKHLD